MSEIILWEGDSEINRRNLLDVARKELPEVEERYGEAEGSYILFGDLGCYLKEDLDNDCLDEGFLSRTLKLLNLTAEHEDPEIQNVLVAGFFESILDHEEIQKILKERLCPEGVKMLERTIAGWWQEE